MNAQEIRDTPFTTTASEESQGAAALCDCSVFLREIAAQLAELNEKLAPGNLIANVHVVELPEGLHNQLADISGVR